MPDKKTQGTKKISVTWVVTILLVVLIVGGADLFTQSKNKKMQEVAKVTASSLSAVPEEKELPDFEVDLDVGDSADSIDKGQSTEAVVEAFVEILEKPDDIDATVPVELELDNLAGSLVLSMPGITNELRRLPLVHSCYRDNITPSLSWSDAPDGTKSFALFMEQRKPDEKPYVNWVLFNIPLDSSGLPENLPREKELADGTSFGRNDNGVSDYAGPCDPKGKVDYAIRLFALDITLDKEADIGKDELIRSMNGHIIDEAEITFYHVLRM